MPFKQALVIRNDLGMGKGKIAAQCAHASLQAYLQSKDSQRKGWMQSGQEKVVLKVQGEKELLAIFNQAKKSGLPTALIQDAGHTQIAPGSKTVVGIGPCEEEELDRITGELKLL
ncbi:peptidyl-tRNA hydrolase [Candidatus Micrarchaeota archaeon]|nr:peptidyl-tRNA hydrolase [Candidatus Micrarchaeota archaeon]